MKKRIMKIFQISDMHLFAKKEHSLLKINTFESFVAVLDLVKLKLAEQKPDLIVLTGDLSQDNSTESYQHVINLMKNIPVDIAWIPGNHDQPIVLQKIFQNSYLNSKKHFLNQNWQLILLDSHQNKKVAGFLNSDQLDFLNNILQSNTEFALIMLHHHVFPLGAVWLDGSILENSSDFLSIIDQYSHVKGVICGHVHQTSKLIKNDVLFVSSPSTCIQFKPQSNQFALDTLMPGFNVIDLYEDGYIETTVHRIPFDAAYVPDLKSKGY